MNKDIIKEKDIEIGSLLSRVYSRKGAQVEVYEAVVIRGPYRNIKLSIAVKTNININKPRHEPSVFERENATLSSLWRNKDLQTFIPMHIEPTNSKIKVITEYLPQSTYLETLIPDTSVNSTTRFMLIKQLVLFLYYLHSVGYHHNDFHDKNILVDDLNNIAVIDFGMSGNKNTEQQRKWQDIHQLNKTIYRLVLSSLDKIPEPWDYTLPEERIRFFIEGLNDIETQDFLRLFRLLPVLDDDLKNFKYLTS